MSRRLQAIVLVAAGALLVVAFATGLSAFLAAEGRSEARLAARFQPEAQTQ